MADLYKLHCCVWILMIICITGNGASTGCRTSPVPLNSSWVGGRATIFLPVSLMNLMLTVEIKKFERDGANFLRLDPVLVDEKKCVTKSKGIHHFCYEFSEIHWGKTSTEGSDHTINGNSYPMEIQHYIRRTNKTHSLAPLGVGVLYKSNQITQLITPEFSKDFEVPNPSQKSAETHLHHMTGLFSYKSLKKDEIYRVKLGDMLPNLVKEFPFFQYTGSISGGCSEEKDWIVYEDPMIVPSTFLELLREIYPDGYANHFKISSEQKCHLHSHYSADATECDGDTPRNIKLIKSGRKTEELVNGSFALEEWTMHIGNATKELETTEIPNESRHKASPRSSVDGLGRHLYAKITAIRYERSESNDTAHVNSTRVASSSVTSSAVTKSSNDSAATPPTNTAIQSSTVLQSVLAENTSPVNTSTALLGPSSHLSTVSSKDTVLSTRVVTSQGEASSLISPTVTGTEVNHTSPLSNPTSVIPSSPITQPSSIRIGRPQDIRHPSNVHASGRQLGSGSAGIESNTDNPNEPVILTAKGSIEDFRKGHSTDSKDNSTVPSVDSSVTAMRSELVLTTLCIVFVWPFY